MAIDSPNTFEGGCDPALYIPDDEIPKLFGKAVKLIPSPLERGLISVKVILSNEGPSMRKGQVY